MTVSIAAFYKFVGIDDGEALRTNLAAAGCRHGLKGTILLAPEGINATVSAQPSDLDAFLGALRTDPRFSDLTVKFSAAPDHPFRRFKVKLKREIITLGAPEANPAKQVGIYVKPEDWNAVITDPAVTVLDTRNAYEVAIGTFARAENPETTAFGQFPDYVKRKLDPKANPRVAMFCTGGIRCEKASAYLLSQGFPEVYHLEGGILKYLETVPKEESLWRGECFVFDERVALDHGVTVGTHVMCPDCGRAIPKDQARSGGLCSGCAGT